ncbi:glycosyltransferase family 52 [Flagellimonas flava]|uniref:Glycosyltransferase family 52 n=1 Tax=Flagellimonas flava TaxID=570519 RepID=A0A1M5HQP8_9FLAO|nr:glycosyltransferase family 52 [Allomuricauda flava]SHG18260.1 Glycosyltransferase family 52 [Allomuricauda flava]
MQRTYVGSTIYHIYLSLIHILKDSNGSVDDYGDNLLFLVESTPMIETLIPNLKKRFFRDVHIISERRDHVKDLGKLNYSVRRKSKLIPYLENRHPTLKKEKEFIKNSELYLCDTDSSKSYFLYEFGKNRDINMIEDGARTYIKRHSTFEQFLKTFITKTPIGGGFDKEIKTIYAQFPRKLPKALQGKSKELNIKKEVALWSKTLKKEVFDIFLNSGSLEIPNKNNALILTQPISEDKVIKNEAVKIEIYKDVVSKIPKNMNIILKTHPRELTKYKEHFKDITVLPALFPIEILGLKEGFHFEQGYTLFSTALSNLEIVKERFFLGKDYLDKFTVGATRDLIKNMEIPS